MTTAKDLIKAGIAEGPWIPEALAAIERGELTLGEAVEKYKQPDKIPLQSGLDWHTNLEATTADEKNNFDSVHATMKAVMKTPGVKSGAVMPDACPAGPVGTIPVGGVVASEYIHPSMHSADVYVSSPVPYLFCTASLQAFVTRGVLPDRSHHPIHVFPHTQSDYHHPEYPETDRHRIPGF